MLKKLNLIITANQKLGASWQLNHTDHVWGLWTISLMITGQMYFSPNRFKRVVIQIAWIWSLVSHCNATFWIRVVFCPGYACPDGPESASGDKAIDMQPIPDNNTSSGQNKDTLQKPLHQPKTVHSRLIPMLGATVPISSTSVLMLACAEPFYVWFWSLLPKKDVVESVGCSTSWMGKGYNIWDF